MKAQLNKMRGIKCMVLESCNACGRSSDDAGLFIDWYVFAAGMKLTRNSSLEARAVALVDLCILDAGAENQRISS